MKHELMELPFAYDALVPTLSKEALLYHHDKHHKTYVNKLNDLIINTKYEDKTLKEIIKSSDGAVFNNAAQIYNHDFFWNSMTPLKTKLSLSLEDAINQNFGLFEDFKNEFIQKGTTHFGSGWVWLVVNEMGKLKIITTQNAHTPIRDNLIPLLVCDLWEHSYYIDYRNSRPTYLDKWWGLINWKFVSLNYEKISALFKPNYIDECNENSAMCNYIHDMVDEERTVS